MAKKKREEEVLDAYNQQAAGIESAGNAVAEGLASAGAAQVADLESAEQARADAYNAAQQLYRERMDQGYKDFADIINTGRTNVMQAEQDAASLAEANRRAARWTGATELASSIANMIAVGNGNAVSQQYNNYSQGWMQKADRDAREHRARIDNLRERQKMLQQHLTQIRLGEAGQALANAQREAEAARQARAQIAGARYNATTAPLNIQLQTAEKAGAARTQGATQAANVGIHEEQMRQSAGQHAAALAQRDRQFNAQMRAKGLNPDGSLNEEYYKEAEKASEIKGGKTLKGLSVPIIDTEGNVNFANVKTKEQYDLFLKTGEKAIANDLDKKSADTFLSQMELADSQDKKEAVILEWAGKSPTMKKVLQGYDSSYNGNHGEGSRNQAGGYVDPDYFIKNVLNL